MIFLFNRRFELREGSLRRTANRQVHLSMVRFGEHKSRISSTDHMLRVTGVEI